ncbi:MAG: two component LuxR family transcriptional regulator [Stygiobacter sp.]|nr:MAG: two component LuxR family transcriptional regulator [Stygiobacter sp.]KAF0217828.1 MAG: two component LuxR family transcriptional [Ignavibacteria bacterium]
MEAEKISLLIADDHPLFRAGVKQSLEKLESVEIYEAEDGDKALDIIRKIEPDVAVIDIRMPGKTGFEILSLLYNTGVATKIILLTMHKNVNYFYKAISVGAKGYLLKETAVQDLVEAVKTVYRGGTFISKRLQAMIESEKSDEFQNKLLIDSVNSLTCAERQIMKLLADWKTNNEIADILSNSIRTIENHRANISEKLNLRGVHSLIQFAIENHELF